MYYDLLSRQSMRPSRYDINHDSSDLHQAGSTAHARQSEKERHAASPLMTELRSTAEPPHENQTKNPALIYRWRTIVLLVFYLPLLILPWVLKCVLSVQRLDGGQYVVQAGVSGKVLSAVARWLRTADVLGTMNGVATIPVMSALITQAAVVHCQRRYRDQKITLRQTMALADRGWADISILWESWETGASSRFLWQSFIFLVICAAQQPLQSLFVGSTIVTMVRCVDVPGPACDFTFAELTVQGRDPEPADMAELPQNVIVQAVAADIGSQSQRAASQYMWPDSSVDQSENMGSPYTGQMFYWYPYEGEKHLFASALPNGTDTGVLRQHAIRFNSTVKCEKIPLSQFPSQCPGARPLTASYSRPGELEVRVCVPGEYGVFPWTLSRNRQDIMEDLYLDVTMALKIDFGETNSNSSDGFTLHCTTATTRGYFELGNAHNDFRPGPLKTLWPSLEEQEKNFNDYVGELWQDKRPTEQDWRRGRFNDTPLDWQGYSDPFDTGELYASGPLMTSALAMFGNGSFFHTASLAENATASDAVSQICRQDSFPFTDLGPGLNAVVPSFGRILPYCDFGVLAEVIREPFRADSHLTQAIAEWTYGWNNTLEAEQALGRSTFSANAAMLRKTVEATEHASARLIWNSPGMPVQRPSRTLAGTIIVSTVIFIQLCGIAYMTWCIYQAPSWSQALDAAAMIRIGGAIRDAGHTLPPLRVLQENELDSLRKIDGVVGVDETTEGQEMRLVLGGQGLVPRART